VSFGTLAWLLIDTFIKGWPGLEGKLFSNPPSTVPEEAGARPAILATIYIALLLLAMTVPIGVATALYLEEYARKERWYNRLLELNIQNLAAVPAIVYGILGLAFIVRGPVGIGRVLLAGAIIIENVFFLPGLGRLVFQAISQRDLIVVQSVVMLLVLAVITVTYLVDLAYAWVDPRLRHR